MEQFFVVNVLTGTLEQFCIVNVGFKKKKKKKAKALLDFQIQEGENVKIYFSFEMTEILSPEVTQEMNDILVVVKFTD